MAGAVFQFEQLKAFTGYSRQADVERCLKRQGVRYFYGKDGVWTTLEAINAALGVQAPSADPAYRADEVL